MQFNASAKYALMAVGYMAQHQDEKLVLSQTISKKYNIPLDYLLKILKELVRANVLRSKRGPRGGYSLAKSLKQISMLEVIEAVDGPFAGQLGLVEHGYKGKYGKKTEQVYTRAIAQAKSILQKAKIASLV